MGVAHSTVRRVVERCGSGVPVPERPGSIHLDRGGTTDRWGNNPGSRLTKRDTFVSFSSRLSPRLPLTSRSTLCRQGPRSVYRVSVVVSQILGSGW